MNVPAKTLRFWQRLPAWLLLPFLGSLSALAFAPVYAFPLLFLCYPLLWAVIEGQDRGWKVFTYAALFGVGHFAVGLYWVGYAFFMQEGVSNWGAGPAVLGLAAGLAIFPATACLVSWSLSRRLQLKPWANAMMFVLCWVGAEWLRGHILTGFPWNLAGYVWGFSDSILQITSIGGIYILSLLTLFWVMAPVLFFVPGERRGAMIWSFLAVLSFFAVGVTGSLRLAQAEVGNVPGVILRIVQANIDQREKWLPHKKADNFLRYLDLSMQDGHEQVTHVIWPETAVPYLVDEEPSRRFLMASVLNPGGYLLTGAVKVSRTTETDGVALWNSMHILDDSGDIQASYDKSHLVPFGEYMPFRGVLGRLGLEKLVPGGIDYSAGPGRRTLSLEGLPAVSPLICYEVIFPGAVTDDENRPLWLLNVTNDAWYGHTSGPYQHLLQSRVRAIEEGLPLVRAAGTGISAVVDPYGRVLAALGLGRAGIIDHKLPQALSNRTFYVLWRELPFGCIFVILILTILFGGRHMTRLNN